MEYSQFKFLALKFMSTFMPKNGKVDSVLTKTSGTDMQMAWKPLPASAAVDHTHLEEDITDLDDYLTDAPSDGSEYVRKDGSWEEATGGGGSADWGDIGGTLSDQIDLQNALDGKTATGHTHTESDITDLGSYADASHTHTESDITDLGSYLTDAASDGTTYGRKDGDWAAIATGGGSALSIIHLGKTSGASQNVGGGNGTVTYLSWDSQIHIDTDDFTHDTVTNNSRIEVDSDGIYIAVCTIAITQGGGARTTYMCGWRVNGGTASLRGAGANYSRGSGYGDARVRLVEPLHLSTGDYVEFMIQVDDSDSAYTSNTIYDDCSAFLIKIA